MPMRTVLGFVAYVANGADGEPKILKGAQGQVYSVNDTGLTTPLAVRDIETEVVKDSPRSNRDGYIGAFKVNISDTASGILWQSGEYVVYQPFLGVKGEKGNQGGLDAAARATILRAEAVADRADAGEFKGDPGDPGQDGSNVLPTGEAIRNAISEGGAARESLETVVSSFARQGGGGQSGPLASGILATLADFGTGKVRLGIAGDSTMNDGNDMPRKLWMMYAAASPDNLNIVEQQWDSGTKSYGTDVTIQAGEVTPSSGGTVIEDDFSMAQSELSGASTSGGQAWVGASGAWSSAGGKATSSGSTALMFDTGAKDHTSEAAFSIITAAHTKQRIARVYVAATSPNPTGGGNYVWAQISVNTSGAPALSLWSRVAGVNTQIGSTVYDIEGITPDSPEPQTMTVKTKIEIQNVQAIFAVGTNPEVAISGTVSEVDYGSLGTFAGISAANTEDAVAVTSFSASTTYTPPQSDGLRIYNGAVGGTKISYQTENVAALYPDPLDVLILGNGHNYGGEPPETFLADIKEFVTAFRAQQPGCLILVTSQNPQQSPSTTIREHAARQAALRNWCYFNSVEYLPAFERFSALPDGGLSYTISDGIHPTYPAFGTLGDSGVVFWANILLNRIAGSQNT